MKRGLRWAALLALVGALSLACGESSPNTLFQGESGSASASAGATGGGGSRAVAVAGSGGASGGSASSNTAGQWSVAGGGGSVDAAGSAGAAGLGGVGGAGGSAGAGGTASTRSCDVTAYGAKGDGTTLNTKALQSAIDACATPTPGTVVVPKGSFLSGALTLKPGANLLLQAGSALVASKNIADFPIGPSRFEGHFQDRPASLLSGTKVDHLRITGPGMLDGNGAAYWSQNLPQGRPRLAFIRDSQDVVVSGVQFKNSPSWNLHLYNCQNVIVENSRFEIDAGADGPSTDGTDIDSCQDVTVRGCYYSVNDDCVVLKGNRYDGLNQSPASPPVSNIHVTDCTFVRGKGALSLGTEAQYVHDVEFDHSTVRGDFPTLRIKMRPDTSGQRYEKINVHDIQIDGVDDILGWELTRGTQISGTPPPAFISEITVANISGKTAAFGNIAANATTDVSKILLKNINVTLTTPTLLATGVKQLTRENGVGNVKAWSATANSGRPGAV